MSGTDQNLIEARFLLEIVHSPVKLSEQQLTDFSRQVISCTINIRKRKLFVSHLILASEFELRYPLYLFVDSARPFDEPPVDLRLTMHNADGSVRRLINIHAEFRDVRLSMVDGAYMTVSSKFRINSIDWNNAGFIGPTD